MYRTEETAATIPAGEYIARYRNAEKFIVFCQACSRYGACWACPPHGFDADEYLSGYRTALIIGTRIIPEPSARAECATPEQGRQAGQRMIVEVRRTLDARLLELERKYPGSRAFYAGTCHLCPEGTCARSEGRPCRYPDKLWPSMEAYGLLVSDACRSAGLEYYHGPGTITYSSCILIN